MTHPGELAALGTAVCWAIGANLFAGAGARMGSQALNRLRIPVAFACLVLTLLVARGAPWPVWATPGATAWLAVSGIAGIVFGDAGYLRALVILGPGLATLIASTSSPLFTTLIAWPLLGERPGPRALLGMALTIAGLAWVLLGRERRARRHVEGSAAAGVLFGVAGGLGQAVGYVLSKHALRTGIDPLSATVVRLGAATAGVWLLAALARQTRATLATLRDRRAAAFMVGGAVSSPFVGVTLSLVAIRYIPAGVAASITAGYPLLAFAIAGRFHGERMELRTWAGALLTVAGVVVLFAR